MIKKEMIAMLLAGGQGSRLGVLTEKVAKPAVAFGGKYRIIDFPLSNCINSGIDTVGVLTQYQPLRLNTHIGIGVPWDLDRTEGGVTVLPPYEKSTNSEWYTGTANAIFQNMAYMEQYNPDYVLILSGDHIYKMDYEVMLDFHKANKADVTIACMPVPIEEASRFGIMVTDETFRVTEFEEKPEHPSSNLASMGIYIFSWPVLKEALYALKDQQSCDFGKHILPYCKDKGQRLFAYEYNGYWKDVGTLGSYWEANMELIDIIPEPRRRRGTSHLRPGHIRPVRRHTAPRPGAAPAAASSVSYHRSSFLEYRTGARGRPQVSNDLIIKAFPRLVKLPAAKK